VSRPAKDRVRTVPIPFETMAQVIRAARCPVCGALQQHDPLCPNAPGAPAPEVTP